jgi:hypothetical protein
MTSKTNTIQQICRHIALKGCPKSSIIIAGVRNKIKVHSWILILTSLNIFSRLKGNRSRDGG